MAIKLQMEVDLAQQYRAFFKETERQPSAETVKSYIQMATETAQTAVTSQLQGTVITDITRRMNEMMLKVSREASKISTSAHEETEPAHFTTLNKVVGELAGLNVDMTATRRILAACAEEKKRLTAQLRNDVQRTLANETQATGQPATEQAGDDTDSLDNKLKKIDERIKMFEGMEAISKSNIKSLLAAEYNTPDGPWNNESKTIKVMKLDPKLAGKPDPKLVETLVVTLRTMLHEHVSRFWAIIPYFECIVANREQTKHWHFPCEKNSYSQIPEKLRPIYMSQSKTLFNQLWGATAGSNQATGSTIVRKTYGEKFLGDSMDSGESVKSSVNDGMMTVYYLITTHESAGYEEKSKLKHTLHQTAAMFATGNPQQKLAPIRLVLDKAMSLGVKIDFEATIKPIVITLRKRSPNFNELAHKYLSVTNIIDWESDALQIFDRLLSEIDHVIDSLGMQSLQELRDSKTKLLETTAKAAYASYTGSATPTTQDGGTADSDLPRKMKCNTKCAASKCSTSISQDQINGVNAYRAKKYKYANGRELNFRPVLCDSCSHKITEGNIKTLNGPDGGKFERTERDGKTGYRFITKDNLQVKAQKTTTEEKAPTKTKDAADNKAHEELKSMMQETLLDILTPIQSSVAQTQPTTTPQAVATPNPAAQAPVATPDPTPDRAAQLQAQLQRLGIVPK